MGEGKRRRKPRQRQPQLAGDPVGHALGPMPSRGQIDAETQKYFSEVLALLETIADDKEREALCASALEEARGKELRLASHPSCGRALEKLIQSFDAARLLSFLGQCTADFASMAMDPSASHVAEMMLGSLSEILQQNGGDAGLISSIESAVARISEVLQGSALEVMGNKYGSHVLRKFTLLAAGLVETEGKDGLSRKLGRMDSMAKTCECIHAGFPRILKQLTSEILVACKSSMSERRMDQFSSLVFQTILKALHGTGSDTSSAIATLLGFDQTEMISPKVLERILELMENQNGSHLMEVILQVASNEVYAKLLEEIFKGNLKRLATHQFSNFALQTLIAFARQEDQVSLFLDELGKDFTELIKKKRAGVIVSLLGVCSRMSTSQHEISRLVATVICPKCASRDTLVLRLLHLEGHDSDGKSGRKMSILGCVMLQILFTFSQDCSQQYYKSFSVLEMTQILEAIKDKAGCHVVEAFLKSPASPKQKHAVIERLKDHFAVLATDTKAHYIVTKCFEAANLKLKESIVMELIGVQNDLSKSRHGPYILGRLNVAKYEKAPDKWRQSQQTSHAHKEDYEKLFKREQPEHHGAPRRKKQKYQ
ncbi:pumilio homolog 23-like [Selaginella moellendorffii]|uniref:pumilio homolog 23-like n=1 Tax=Selaginella moellendorffii TaxID=88036 RepID=UPI000D1CD38D|nr:pumilio homolog 23-like [Selaginella moellendorffii]|eukprot:XP_024519531.1 pumilio homolog 23-like [Selaginella moellendorffii]